MRFISIILDPSHLWSDHGVVDTERNALICRCADSRDADVIAKVLNLQQSDREVVAFLQERNPDL